MLHVGAYCMYVRIYNMSKFHGTLHDSVLSCENFMFIKSLQACILTYIIVQDVNLL